MNGSIQLEMERMERGEMMESGNGLSGNDGTNNNNEEEEEEEEGTYNGVGELLEEFAGGTSLPGVPRAVDAPSRISRIFWIIVIVTCVIMFFWGISDLLKLYFSYPKQVTVEMVSEPVSFPSVTICNMRSLNFDTLNRINDMLLKDPTAASYVNQTFDDEPFLGDYFRFVSKVARLRSKDQRNLAHGGRSTELRAALDEGLTRTALFAEISDEVLSSAGIKLEQYVATCSLGGVRCNMSRDFKLFFHAYYFNCYTYNAPGSSPSDDNNNNNNNDNNNNLPWLTPGLDNGLSLVLLTGSGMLDKNADVTLTPGLYDTGSAKAGSDGVRVMVHAPSVRPFPLAEGFDVPPGFSASLGIKPRRNLRIGPPHGDCRSEGLRMLGGSAEEVEYRQLACQQLCVQKYVVEQCGCYDETLPCRPEDGGPPTCRSSAHFPAHCKFRADDACFDALRLQYRRVECSREVREKVRLNRSMIAECSCRPNCEELVYEVSYSVSEWPANGFEGDAALRDIVDVHNFTLARFSEAERKHFEKLDRWEFMGNFARINVYVADPGVLVTRESPAYDVSQLISDVGGQLGVWLGLSLITAAELVQLVGQIFNRLFVNNKRRRRRRCRNQHSLGV